MNAPTTPRPVPADGPGARGQSPRSADNAFAAFAPMLPVLIEQAKAKLATMSDDSLDALASKVVADNDEALRRVAFAILRACSAKRFGVTPERSQFMVRLPAGMHCPGGAVVPVHGWVELPKN